MSYGTVKTQFQALLNRRDITPSLVTTFIGYGIQRIQRTLRVPSMERVVELTTDGTSELSMPTDLLEIISLHVNDDTNGRTKLIKTDLQTILTHAAYQGQPKYYHREGSTIYMGPFPADAQPVFIHYFADFSGLTEDDDENWLTEVAPTLVVYAALTYAASYFLDDRREMFEAEYLNISREFKEMAQDDETVNASISLSFNMD
jgi:hypothetical protein